MNEITKTPTAELIAFINRGCAKCTQCGKRFSFDKMPTYRDVDRRIFSCSGCGNDDYQKAPHSDEVVQPIAEELDRRCEAAGISLGKDGMFWYKNMLKSNDGSYCHLSLGGAKLFISGEEQHELEGWLLIREGK